MTNRKNTASTLAHAGIRLAARLLPGGDTRVPGLPDPMPRESDVRSDDVTLHRLEWAGDGDPLVLLHGLDVNSWIWAPTASLLKGGRTPFPGPIHAFDLRGHGLSSSPDTGYALATTCADVLSALDGLGIGRFHLAGHSWGGKNATYLASEAPDRVLSLVLADPVPPAGFNPFLRALPRLVDTVLAPERGPYADDASLKAGLTRMVYMRGWDAMDRKLASSAFRKQPDGSYSHTLPETGYREILDGALQEDIRPRLTAIRCPALLMLPTFTVSFWPGESRQYRFGSGGPPAVRRVPGDHSFIYTNPIETASVIGDFFDEGLQS